MVLSAMKVVQGPWCDARISDKLHKLILTLPHRQSLLAKKILAKDLSCHRAGTDVTSANSSVDFLEYLLAFDFADAVE
jgi:hypothetical protein